MRPDAGPRWGGERWNPMRRIFLVVFAVVLVAAACGDDDDTLTQAQFVEQANAICEEGNEDFNKLFETDFPASPNKLRPFFEKATPIAEREVEGIRDLGAPEGQEDEYEELLRLGDAVVADFRAASEDQDKAAELFQAEGGDNSAKLEEKAEALGLDKCAEDEDEEEEGVTLLDPATFSPEKRAYVEQADAICAETQEQENALEEEHLSTFPPPIENWAKFLPAVVQVNREMLAELEALTPPPGDEDEVGAVLGDFESVVDEFEELGQLAAEGNSEEFDPRLQELFPRFDEIEQGFAEYGFQVCGIEQAEDEGGDEE